MKLPIGSSADSAWTSTGASIISTNDGLNSLHGRRRRKLYQADPRSMSWNPRELRSSSIISSMSF
jgi:hypothetical protein